MDRIHIKKKARNTIINGGDHKPNIFIVAGIYIIILILLNLVIELLSDYNDIYEQYMSAAWGSGDLMIPQITLAGTLFYLAATLMRDFISLGFRLYCLRRIRGEKGEIFCLFEGFEHFWRYLILLILKKLIIFVGCIFLILPGIIAAIVFSQAEYILLDNQEMGPIACLRESARLMRGLWGEYVVLNLSLIGWSALILAATALLGTVGYIVYIWTMPYTGLVYAGFYQSLIEIRRSQAFNQ